MNNIRRNDAGPIGVHRGRQLCWATGMCLADGSGDDLTDTDEERPARSSSLWADAELSDWQMRRADLALTSYRRELALCRSRACSDLRDASRKLAPLDCWMVGRCGRAPGAHYFRSGESGGAVMRERDRGKKAAVVA